MKQFLHLLFGAAFLFTGGDDKPSTPESSLESRSDVIASRFDSLFTGLAQRKGFNGTVLVGIGGNTVYKEAFGYSDLRAKTPLDVRSVFQIASVTKQFTAVAVMMLRERGLLDYDDSVQKFIPGFPYKNITVRHLLAHRSGLPNYMYFSGKYWKNKRKPLTNDDLLAMIERYRPGLEFLPDRRYKYSNTGYAVLASIVEKVSGLPYDEFLEENIFRPLGMHSTFVFNPANTKTIEFQTKGHSKNKRTYPADFLDGVSGDKGIYSTVDDLFLWDQALYTESLVSRTTLDEAFIPSSYDVKRENNYGFGWRIDTLEDGSKVVYHGGWWRGYNSLFVRRLDDHSTIIILSNRVNWSWGEKEDLISLIDSSDNE